MRLWSLHPSYLDSRGLVACWREGLLARKVLLGETVGYRNHPQLARFATLTDPVSAIDQYLSAVLSEADQRGYQFNPAKIARTSSNLQITVTEGQLRYELAHLKSKLVERDYDQFLRLKSITLPRPNPIFKVIQGTIEPWEKIKQANKNKEIS